MNRIVSGPRRLHRRTGRLQISARWALCDVWAGLRARQGGLSTTHGQTPETGKVGFMRRMGRA
eukprot:135497-Chlamydomonas_euryale.AAC.1